ncbi:MAG TPA: ABC transporter substrate-binding protein [Pseudolabrys sp.]|nr:ABC transporter substrate-binding protein [Pseudolabrys sp.]
MKITVVLFNALIAFAACSSHAAATDTLKIVAGGHGNWDSSPAELGQKAGIFNKHGINLEIVYSAGSGETLQTVISGSADVGIAIGTGSAMAAYLKGAPVRIIGAVTTGAADVYWYVPNDSHLKTLKDANANTTIAYSSSGSSTYVLAQEILKLYGIQARLAGTGGPQATLTQVESGQIDIGYATAPFGLQQVADGKIRIIARAAEVPGANTETVRVLVANANKLASSRDVIKRFINAYAETVEWMYSSPNAVQLYSQYSKIPMAIAKQGMSEFYTKEMLNPYRISNLDQVMADSIKMKILKTALTRDQLRGLVQVPKPQN